MQASPYSNTVLLVDPASRSFAIPGSVVECASAQLLLSTAKDAPSCALAAVLDADNVARADLLEAIRALRREIPTVFTVVFGELTQDVALRMTCFESGANMLTNSHKDLMSVLDKIRQQGHGDLACPSCGLGGLSESELHFHHAAYHATQPNHDGCCPICERHARNLAVHLHNSHGPVEDREQPPKNPGFAAFAWVVCRRSDGKFLMVNEPAGICSHGTPGYWLPAGRVDPGESLIAAAVRETLEEGGVNVRIDGVLRFMFDKRLTPRIVFLASADMDEAKSIPDWESAGAVWVEASALSDLSESHYRSSDPAEFFPAVASGMPCHSLETESFRELDAAVQELTQCERSLGRLRSAVQALAKEYPRSAFDELFTLSFRQKLRSCHGMSGF